MARPSRSPEALAIALACLALAAGAGAQRPEAGPPACDRAEHFREVPGQGPSCPDAEGGWLVDAGKGHRVRTHGPDAAPAPAAGLEFFQNVTARAPRCAPDPGMDPHGLVVYARPQDRASRYAALLPTLRASLALANGKLHQEAMEFGVGADFTMRCDGALLRVEQATLPTPAAQSTFSTIVRDLRDLGYTSPLTKYWVLFETGGAAVRGQGSIANDDRVLADNANNAGPSFAVLFGCNPGQQATCGYVLMHEAAHNLGAVQLSAPHSSGAFHCNDERDMMCYADGGFRSRVVTLCTDQEHFDCRHDDYFHPAPANGSYLATHWNLGSRLVRFVKFSDMVQPPGPATNVRAGQKVDVGLSTMSAATRVTWEPPATLGSGPILNYRIYATPLGGAEQYLGQVGDTRAFDHVASPGQRSFTYRVAAVNGAGEGPRADAAFA